MTDTTENPDPSPKCNPPESSLEEQAIEIPQEKPRNWKKYGLEFLTMFIAVISAFALNNWNDNRKDANSENKILIEINNGLEKDLEDIKLNVMGHHWGLEACVYFRKVLTDEKVEQDSAKLHYHNLTRDFVCIQNVAGYETLKSKGLEIIKNDSLREQIISLYEYEYIAIRKFEEEYSEGQFQASYFKEINANLASSFVLDSNQVISGIRFPLEIEPEKRKILLLYLWKIEVNRNFILKYYAEVERQINKVRESIEAEIESKNNSI